MVNLHFLALFHYSLWDKQPRLRPISLEVTEHITAMLALVTSGPLFGL